MNIYWIYCLENKITGKKYIGKTNDPKLRLKRHIWNSKKLIGKQYIHKAINKYGINNFWFKCIDYCFSEEEALTQEMFYIKLHKTKNSDYGYNLTDGGEGSSGYKHTQESKNKMSAKARAKIGILNSFYGKKHTTETVLKSRGENNKSSILIETKVVDILDMYYTGKFTEAALSIIFGVKRQTINDILRGKRWKHVKRDEEKIFKIKRINKSKGSLSLS